MTNTPRGTQLYGARREVTNEQSRPCSGEQIVQPSQRGDANRAVIPRLPEQQVVRKQPVKQTRGPDPRRWPSLPT